VTTHVAAPRRDEPGERIQIIPHQRADDTHVMPAIRMPIAPRATTMAQRHASWLPRMWPPVAWFVVVLAVTLALSVKSTGPLGAVVTIVWT
jgi:beta-1,4-mannosyltransferase